MLGIYLSYLSAGMLQEAISSYRSKDGDRYNLRDGNMEGYQARSLDSGSCWSEIVSSPSGHLLKEIPEMRRLRAALKGDNKGSSAFAGLGDPEKYNQALHSIVKYAISYI